MLHLVIWIWIKFMLDHWNDSFEFLQFCFVVIQKINIVHFFCVIFLLFGIVNDGSSWSWSVECLLINLYCKLYNTKCFFFFLVFRVVLQSLYLFIYSSLLWLSYCQINYCQSEILFVEKDNCLHFAFIGARSHKKSRCTTQRDTCFSDSLLPKNFTTTCYIDITNNITC